MYQAAETTSLLEQDTDRWKKKKKQTSFWDRVWSILMVWVLSVLSFWDGALSALSFGDMVFSVVCFLVWVFSVLVFLG